MQGFFCGLPCCLGILFNIICNTLDESMLQSLVDVPLAPFRVFLNLFVRAITRVLSGNLQQPLRGIFTAIEYHVFHPLT